MAIMIVLMDTEEVVVAGITTIQMKTPILRIQILMNQGVEEEKEDTEYQLLMKRTEMEEMAMDSFLESLAVKFC